MADDNKGFIKLDRRLLEWAWHDDISTLVLWIHILLLANYEDKKWHEYDVPAGSFITSITHLADVTNLARCTVRRCLENLEKTGEITKIVRPRKHTQIIVNNWEKYQSIGKKKTITSTNTTTNTPTNSPTNTTTNTLDTTKEIKKERKEEGKNTTSSRYASEEEHQRVLKALFGKTPEEEELERETLKMIEEENNAKSARNSQTS